MEAIEEKLKRLWCELNRWEDPEELQNVEGWHDKRSTLMGFIEAVIPKKEILSRWNSNSAQESGKETK